MQGADAEAVLLQRFVDNGDFALAVAEDDRVLEILGVAQQAAQDLALLVRLAAGGDLELGDTPTRGGGLGDFDRSGLCRKASVMRLISGGIVAVKNSVCRVNGTSLQMRSMSGMKPMSSMRSASSMTRSSTPVSSSRRARCGRAGGRGSRSARRRRASAWCPGRRTRRRRSAARR
jgi:hypothetical protein